MSGLFNVYVHVRQYDSEYNSDYEIVSLVPIFDIAKNQLGTLKKRKSNLVLSGNISKNINSKGLLKSLLQK